MRGWGQHGRGSAFGGRAQRRGRGAAWGGGAVATGEPWAEVCAARGSGHGHGHGHSERAVASSWSLRASLSCGQVPDLLRCTRVACHLLA